MVRPEEQNVKRLVNPSGARTHGRLAFMAVALPTELPGHTSSDVHNARLLPGVPSRCAYTHRDIQLADWAEFLFEVCVSKVLHDQIKI